MCDNIDALLADEGGLDGDYDIRAEDEEALLEEDNFDDQNIVSSTNRNYYASREELEEEELDHEPEEPEEVLELDGNVSDLPDEDPGDSLNNSANQREKRDTKFVSERILPNKSFENAENTTNYNKKKLFARPQQQQQQQQHFNNRNNQMFNNRGIRGRGFGGRGRGNIGNRPEGKKVLINPHFQGNAPFNNQARPPWNVNANNPGRGQQPWRPQRMPHPQHNMQMQRPPFQQQMPRQNQNNRFVQHHQQQQIDFVEPNRMVHIPPQQSLQLKAPVHQRLGNLNQPPIIDLTQQQPPQHFIDQQPPFIQPQHHHQPPPPQQFYHQSPPQQVQQQFAPPNQQFIQPPPVQQQPQYVVNQPQGYAMNVPPPQPSTTFVQQPQFSSPPPCYAQSGYEQQNVVFQQQAGGFDFQPPVMQPQVQMQEQQVQFQQQQQQVGYQAQQPVVYQHQQLQQLNMPPPNMPQTYQQDFPPPNETHHQFTTNPPQYIQNQPLNVENQQERRTYTARATHETRLGPPTNKQQQNVPQKNVRFVQRSNVTRGGGNNIRGSAGTSNRGGLVSPGKRRYPPMEGGVDQRRRRTELVQLRHEVPKVDSTVNSTTVVHRHLSSITPVSTSTMKKVEEQTEIEEDEETRVYRQKIENQKRIREQILAQKEERRKQAARKIAAETELASLQPPSAIIAAKVSPIKTIVTTQQQQPNLTKRRLVNINTPLSNRIMTQATTPIAEIITTTQAATTTTTTGDISSFLTNRRIIAKDQSLPDTKIVVVSNLAAGTTEVKLRRLCQGVGNVQIFGHISGAHLNPAVTIAAVFLGYLKPELAVIYFGAQFSGAILGFSALKALIPRDLTVTEVFDEVTNTTTKIAGLCSTMPHEKVSALQATFIEAIATAVLILICCAIWDKRNASKGDSLSLRFGLAVAGLAMVTGPFTGCSMNTARSFAPALLNGDWHAHWVYWIGPTFGTVVAATFYKFLYFVEADSESQDDEGTPLERTILRKDQDENKV